MKQQTKETTKKLLVKGITLTSAFLLKRLTENYLEKNTGKELPKKPDQKNNQTWGQAITYAACTGAFLGAFKLVVDRMADQRLEKALN